MQGILPIKGKRSLNCFNFSSSPLPNLIFPQTLTILSLELSAHGNSGVIFIQLPEGSFVLKPCCNAPIELFYNKMAQHFGLRVPETRVFLAEQPIYYKILQAVQQYCAEKDECLYARLNTKFNTLFCVIFQYVPSLSYDRIGLEKTQKIMSVAERLFQLGNCLGYDMIINNHDRFQFIWGGDGNVDNVLINCEGEHVFIDNQGNMCDVTVEGIAKNVLKYFQRVIEMVETIELILKSQNYEENIKNNIYFEKFRTQIQLYTGYKLDERQMYQICLGIQNTVQVFLHLQKSKKIQKLYDKIVSMSVKMEKNLYASHWLTKMDSINMSYCSLLYQKLLAIKSQKQR